MKIHKQFTDILHYSPLSGNEEWEIEKNHVGGGDQRISLITTDRRHRIFMSVADFCGLVSIKAITNFEI